MDDISNREKDNKEYNSEEIEVNKTDETVLKNTLSRNIKKDVGIIEALSIVIGNIIGSGIFVNAAGTLQASPYSAGISLILWTFGGIMAMMGALCFVELFSYVKLSGGEKIYLRKAYGVPIAVVFTYQYTGLNTPLTLAYGSLTAGSYIITTIFPNCPNNELAQKLIALSIIILVFILNSTSNYLSTKLIILFTIAKSLALIIIIITGFVYLGRGGVDNFKNPFNTTDFDGLKLTFAIASSLWAYGGWNTLGHIAGDMKNPNRNLPIAFISGISFVTIVYILCIISYISVLGVETVGSTKAVAASLGNVAFGKFSWVIPVFIILSIIGFINGTAWSAARVAMTSGQHGDIPYMFSLVHKKQRTPVVSLFTSVIISCILINVDFNDLLSYSSFLSWLFYGLAASCIFYYRYYKKMESSFRVPIIFPIIIMMGGIYIFVMTFYQNPLGCFFIFLFIAVIFGVYYIPDKFLHPLWAKKFLGYISYGLKVGYNLEAASLKDLSTE